MKKLLYSLTIASAVFSFAACDLQELPVSTASNQAIFGSASGMELYTTSFYDILPNTDVGVFQDDDESDLIARNGVGDFLAVGVLSPVTSSGWSWGNLRNINYFIENAEKYCNRKGKLYWCSTVFQGIVLFRYG